MASWEITPVDNQERYVIKFHYWSDIDGWMETVQVVTPDELGEFMYETMPYKPDHKPRPKIKRVK